MIYQKLPHNSSKYPYIYISIPNRQNLTRFLIFFIFFIIFDNYSINLVLIFSLTTPAHCTSTTRSSSFFLHAFSHLHRTPLHILRIAPFRCVNLLLKFSISLTAQFYGTKENSLCELPPIMN